MVLRRIWTYSIPLWDSAANSNIQIIQRVENDILRKSQGLFGTSPIINYTKIWLSKWLIKLLPEPPSDMRSDSTSTQIRKQSYCSKIQAKYMSEKSKTTNVIQKELRFTSAVGEESSNIPWPNNGDLASDFLLTKVYEDIFLRVEGQIICSQYRVRYRNRKLGFVSGSRFSILPTNVQKTIIFENLFTSILSIRER